MRSPVIFLALLVGVLGCSNLPTKREAILRHDATVWIPGTAPVQKKAGDAIPVDGDGVYINAPGRLGMMVVAPSGGTLEIEARPLEEVTADAFEKRVNVLLGDILGEVGEVQALMRFGRNKEALEKTDEILRKHPSVTYLYLLRASALTLLGRRQDARAALDVVLKEFPSDLPARGLYSRIAEPKE